MLDLSRVRVTVAERAELEKRMGNWVDLQAHLAKHPPTVGLAEKMLKVELERRDRERPSMVERLLGIYHTLCREANRDAVAAVLANLVCVEVVDVGFAGFDEL